MMMCFLGIVQRGGHLVAVFEAVGLFCFSSDGPDRAHELMFFLNESQLNMRMRILPLSGMELGDEEYGLACLLNERRIRREKVMKALEPYYEQVRILMNKFVPDEF